MEFDPGQCYPLEHWSDIVQLFLTQITAVLIYSILYVYIIYMGCCECNFGWMRIETTKIPSIPHFQTVTYTINPILFSKQQVRKTG